MSGLAWLQLSEPPLWEHLSHIQDGCSPQRRTSSPRVSQDAGETSQPQPFYPANREIQNSSLYKHFLEAVFEDVGRDVEEHLNSGAD